VSAPPAQQPLVTVELQGLPVAVQVRATEHMQDLQREFVLIADGLQHSQDTPALPRRLLDLVDALQRQYGGFTEEQEDQLDEAHRDGRATLDLTFRVPADVTDAAVALGTLLDEADAFCREGRHLLTLATPPDLVAYRRWYLQQFVDQVAGHRPTPWDGPLD
jgi:hypothetical protein